jgi:hypothetical protein
MLIDSIKKSKLYDNTNEIRIGVVNESGKLIKDEILNDPKFEIVYIGKDKEYEKYRKYTNIYSDTYDCLNLYVLYWYGSKNKEKNLRSLYLCGKERAKKILRKVKSG